MWAAYCDGLRERSEGWFAGAAATQSTSDRKPVCHAELIQVWTVQRRSKPIVAEGLGPVYITSKHAYKEEDRTYASA